MPPKGGKKKPSKPSKEELEAERKRKEDEERVLREAEAKRLEEERIQQEIRAKKLKEEQLAFRVDELARLKREVEDHAHIIAAANTMLEQEQQREEKAVAWAKYLLCDSKPDASALSDINTFVSLTSEETLVDLNEALQAVSRSNNIASSLQDVLALAHASEKMQAVRQYDALLTRLWESSLEKIDRVTAHLLTYADELEESSRGEVIVAKREGKVRFGLWVNKELKGKKRLIDFGEAGMSVDVPKQVAQTSLAVRNLFVPITRYVSRAHVASSNNAEGHSSMGATNLYASTIVATPGATGEAQVNGEKDLVLGGLYIFELLAISPPPKKVKGWVLRPETSLARDVQRLVYPLGTLESASLAALAAAPPVRCTCELPSNVIIPPQPRVTWWDSGRRAWSEEFISDLDVIPEKRIMRFQTLKSGVFSLLQPVSQDIPYKSWSLEAAHTPRPHSATEASALRLPEARFTIVTPRFTVEIHITGHRCRLQKPDMAELSEVLGKDWSPGELLHHLSRAGIHLMPTDDVARRASTSNRPWTLKAKELEAHFPSEIASIAASFDVKSSTLNQQLPSSQTTFYLRESSAFTGMNEETLEYVPVLLEVDDASISAQNAPSAGTLGLPGVKLCVIEPSPQEVTVDRFMFEPAEGQQTHIYLTELLQRDGRLASHEALERIDTGSSVRFQDTIRQLLRMTRVLAFC